MASASRLEASLYREHLEDASFLYEQRMQWLEDPQLSLADVERLEERLEAHLDGLAVGAERARPQLGHAIAHGDHGELHAALRVASRREDDELLQGLAARLSTADAQAAEAAALALAFEESPVHERAIAAALTDRRLRPAWARAAGYRELAVGAILLASIHGEPEPDHWTVWALGELRHAPALARLRELAAADEAPTSRDARLALLKLGERGPQAMHSDPILRALVDDDAGAWLCRVAEARADEDLAHALGLCGDPHALGLLLELLREDAVAASAAAGLLLATGVMVFEAATEPDFAELIGEPEAPTSPSRLQLCRDPDVWREQLRGHEASRPSRMGTPRSAASSARAIATLALPLRIRGHICDELAIREGTRLRPDMPAALQRRRLQRLWLGAA